MLVSIFLLHTTATGTYFTSSKVSGLTYTPYAQVHAMHWVGFDGARNKDSHRETMDRFGTGSLVGVVRPTAVWLSTQPKPGASMPSTSAPASKFTGN